MEFEWDPGKSSLNQQKHGLSFEQAARLWMVPAVEIQARTVDEPRAMLIGKIQEKFYSCIFTRRGSVLRLISARPSRKKEVMIYHEHIQKKEN